GLRNAATFNNTGGEIQIDNSTGAGSHNYLNTFTNSGKIQIGANAAVETEGINNQATFTNQACGQLKVLRGKATHLSGSFTNEGYLLVLNELANSITLVNNGVLKYGSTSGSGSISNTTAPSLIVKNSPTPIFTYGGTYNGTVNGIFKDEAATVSAGAF